MSKAAVKVKEEKIRHSKLNWKIYFKDNYDLYLFLLPAMLIILVFAYFPLYGIQIAWRDFSPRLGIWGSDFIGWDNFTRFFNSASAWQIIKNTFVLSIYGLIAGFPIPIILAIFLNSMKSVKYRKVIQTVTYAPNFISVIVIAGMIILFTSPRNGVVNMILQSFGAEAVNFMAEPKLFTHIYVWTGVWQSMGFSSIIYFAALSGVSPELHEAAIMDGATRLQRIWHIDLPCIMPTASILLIMSFGSLFSIGFDKAYALQNPTNLMTSEILSTYVYKMGIVENDMGLSTAIGLMNSAVNSVLLVAVNWISKKLSGNSLW